MDVTFFENKPYYPNSAIQGEKNGQELQDKNWISLIDTTSKTPSSPSPILTFVPVSSHPIPLSKPIPNPESRVSSPTCVQNTELQVYSQRKRQPERPESELVPTQQIQESNLSLSTPELDSVSVAEKGTEINQNLDQHFVSVIEKGTETYQDLDQLIALRKGICSCTQHPLRYHLSYSNLSPGYRAFVTSLDQIQIPNSVQEALKMSQWKAATFKELRALEKNGTWTLTDLPPGNMLLDVNGFSQSNIKQMKMLSGLSDYQEIFAPVAKLNTIRVLSIAVNQDRPLFQQDVKNAFLDGDLAEEVYMDIPPGFEDKFAKGKVYKLQKSLYGLKQSPRAWFKRFSRVLRHDGYTQCQADHTLFVKHSTSDKITVLIVYVDDIVLTGNCKEEMAHLKHLHSREFEIKDMEHLKYFLGMEVARSSRGISVSQRMNTLDLLRETGMSGCKPIETSMDHNTKLGNIIQGEVVDRDRYQRLVGKLIY